MEPIKPTPVCDVRCELGEGPIWLAESSAIAWVDISQRRIHVWDPIRETHKSIATGKMVGAIAPIGQYSLVAGLADEFASVNLHSGSIRTLVPIDDPAPTNRMNDGKCDSRGRFWAGTMSMTGTIGAGALYRLDPELIVTRVLDDVTISNGLGWSPDDRAIYYIDSPTQRIDAFDFDAETGRLSNRRTIVTVDEADGMPDGMTVDIEGYLWVAFWGGGCVRRFSPKGELSMTVKLPVTQVTSCTFGGDDLGDLYITTAAYRLPASDISSQPQAGKLFACRPGVAGLPPRAFAG